MLADNPRGDAIIHTNIACGILGTAAVMARFLARWKSKTPFAADDWCILASLIPSYGMMVSSSFMVARGGAGKDAHTLTHDETRIFLQTYNACLETYSITTVMVKISILLLYRRLFVTPAFRKATIGLGFVCICWGLTATIGILLHCHPVTDMWVLKDTVNPHKCLLIKTFMTAVLVPNLVLDVVVLCLPLYIVWNLKLQRSEKAIISALFLVGGLSCIASMIRLIELRIVVSKDFSYTFVKTYIWSQIEPTTAIICACLTTCRPLFAAVKLPTLKSWTTGRSWTSSRSNTTKDESYILTTTTAPRHRGGSRSGLHSKRPLYSATTMRGKDCESGKLKGPTVAVEEVPITPAGSRDGRVDEFEVCYERAVNADFV